MNSQNQFHLDSSVFKKMLAQNLLLPIFLALVLVIILTSQVYRLLKANEALEHSSAIMSQSNSVFRLIVEGDNGSRGYQISGDEDFLRIYEQATAELKVEIQKLKELLVDKPEHLQRVDLVEISYDNWKNMTSKVIDLKRIGLRAEPEVLLGRKEHLDRARSELDSLGGSETSRRTQIAAEAKMATMSTLALTIILGLIAGLVLSVFGVRQLRLLSSNYAEVIASLNYANTHLEEEVNRRTLDLVATNQELEAFSYSVSHDLRAPLRNIGGFSQALLNDHQSSLNPEGKMYLGFISQGVDKMTSLIGNLLDLSKVTRADLIRTKVDLAPIAEQIVNDLKSESLSRSVQFKNMPSAWVEADADLIAVVLQNLLANAWKFSERKTMTSIEFGVKESQQGFVYFVRDQGAGFDMRYQDKLFGAFQRLHSSQEFEGTGVGLATVKRIISRHGGDIWAESRVGEGSTFYFTIDKKHISPT